MKLSLNWLSDFIDLSGLDTSEIVEQMVKCGFEVESIERMSQGSNLVVGKVLPVCKYTHDRYVYANFFTGKLRLSDSLAKKCPIF